MSNLRRPPAEIAELRRRRDELSQDLAVLRRERDLETRAEEKLRQDEVIRQREGRFEEVETELRPSELVEKADELERKQSWAAAITAWQQLTELRPEAPEPAIEIARLREREGVAARLQRVSAGVTRRRRELGEAWSEVRTSLQRMRGTGIVEEEPLVLIGELLDGSLDPEGFARDWRELHRHAVAPAEAAPSYEVLAGRLRRGDMALLLGSDVPRNCDRALPGGVQLAGQLAERVEGVDPSQTLATVGEYYQLSEHGRSSLVGHLRELLPSCEVPLYDLLAGISSPLVLVSLAWDELLEDAFRATGKPFAVVSPLVTGTAQRADLAVERSDDEEVERIEAEALSGLRLIDKGYSLIYKARGAIAPEEAGRGRPPEALTLAERDHFAFARRQNVLLPSYLARRLAERGLLIVGLAARQWEDRLLLDAVLDKRQGAEKPFVVRQTSDPFENVYWQEHAKRFAVALPQLVEGLAAHLPGVGER